MDLQEGHIYYVDPFVFKNGGSPADKLFVVLKTLPDGGVVGILATSQYHGLLPDGLSQDGMTPQTNGRGGVVATAVSDAVTFTDSGFRFAKDTIFFAEQAYHYSRRDLNRAVGSATTVTDYGAVREELLRDITAMVSQPGLGNETAIKYLSRERRAAGFSSRDDDTLSMIGLTKQQKAALLREKTLRFDHPRVPGGRVTLTLDGGSVSVVSAAGAPLGPLSSLRRHMQDMQGDAAEAPAEADLRPYLAQESAVEWLSRHLGGGTDVDRKAMYHLNLINSFLQDDKEILQRLPQGALGGLPEGGRRNVAAAALLRAGAAAGGAQPQALRPSGYTYEQELVGRWAERDGCWRDMADTWHVTHGREVIAEGSEARVYKGDDGYCHKIVDAGHYGSLQGLLDRISMHNAVFPETAMRVDGFGMKDEADDNAGYTVLVSQPFVKGAPCDAESVLSMMEQRGFTMPGKEGLRAVQAESRRRGMELPQYSIFYRFVSPDGVHVHDLNSQNMVLSPEGNILVFDCDVTLNKDPMAGPVHEVPPVRYDEDAVRAIDGVLERLVPQERDRAALETLFCDEDLRGELRATGRHQGCLWVPSMHDYCHVAVDPQDATRVLVLPRGSAALMLSRQRDIRISDEERAILADGGTIRRGNATLAFDLDKGRIARTRSRRKRQYVAVDTPRAQEAQREEAARRQGLR